jgi:type IV secretory pathway VirJ component
LRGIALLGPADTAEFEFHVGDWLGRRGRSAYGTAAEAARLTVPVLCVQGGEENDSACRNLSGSHVTSLTIGQGHHFSAKYEKLVEAILEMSDHSRNRRASPGRNHR